MKQSGWILDLYPRAGQMIVWLKKQDGKCIRLVDEWTPKMHIGGDFSDLLNLACQPLMDRCRLVEAFEKAGDQSRSTVLEVEVRSEKEASSLASSVEKYGGYSKFRLYDVDVPSTQMYLYERDLFPLAYVEVENGRNGIQWTVRDSREAVDYTLPPLKQVRLQVETTKSGRIRRFEDELDAITITQGNEKTVIDFGDESHKLLELVDVFRQIDPDIVLTDGGDSFIFPYLARRAQQNGILDRFVLDREGKTLTVYETQGHSYFSYGKILYRQTAARLLGRIHIDEMNAFFVNDCGLKGLFEVARTCVIPIQRTSRTTIGTSMTSLQLYHAVKQKILIPWNKNDPEEFKNGNELVTADRGGFIFEPKGVIHDDVGELDFASLYPTIMLRHNLSGETVSCKCCPNSTDRVPELDFNICERWIGIVPRSLDILLRKRTQYKELKKTATSPLARLRYDRRQAALKWILVCSFGYLGFKNARFGKIDAHIATCAFSRDALRKAVAIAESSGFNLVHGIVDSMWLKKPNATDAEYEKVCELIEEELKLPISFEGRYKWIVFLNSRINPKIPVLNRYYGMFQNGTLKVRGIDLRRHDTPEIVRKCQKDMLNVLAHAKDSREFIELIPKALAVMRTYVSALRTHKISTEELVVEKRLSKMPNEYSNLVPQAIAARHLLKEGGTVHAGQSVNFVITRNESKIPENRTLPAELIDPTAPYDAESYVDLVLSSAVNLLLPFRYDLKSLKKLGLQR